MPSKVGATSSAAVEDAHKRDIEASALVGESQDTYDAVWWHVVQHSTFVYMQQPIVLYTYIYSGKHSTK
jgi:hypothetical protein